MSKYIPFLANNKKNEDKKILAELNMINDIFRGIIM